MANILKDVLTKEGLTQATLAKSANMSTGTVNKICNNSRTGAPSTQHLLVKTLNKLIKEEKYNHKEIFKLK